MKLQTELKTYQQKIINKLYDNFKEINSINILDFSPRESMTCRGCGSDYFVKNGTHKGKQRYKCKKCGCTQYSDANTSLYKLKKKDKWVDFVNIMLDKEQVYSCKRISEILEINVKTAHFWRHKFLSGLYYVQPLDVENELELDEIYLPFCVKGRLGKEKFIEYYGDGHPDNVESQLRKDEIIMENGKYQTISLCAHNRNSDFEFKPIKVLKKGIVNKKDLDRVLINFELSGKTIITDSEPSMKACLNDKIEVNHLTFKSSDIKLGIIEEKTIHNNNINNVMKRLNQWLMNFGGVSTKYINNYLIWFRFQEIFKFENIRNMIINTVKDKKSYNRFNSLFVDYKAFVYI